MLFNLCWEIWSPSAGINTDPPFLLQALACNGDFFYIFLPGCRPTQTVWNDALWRRSVCSVSFCLAWVQDLLVMALEFFKTLSTFLQVNCDCDKAVLSKPTFIWHQLLHVTTLVDFPPSPEVEDRPKQLVLDPSVWGLLPVPSSSSILLKIISLARFSRIRMRV